MHAVTAKFPLSRLHTCHLVINFHLCSGLAKEESDGAGLASSGRFGLAD
jgi:hypothetical protein